MGDAEPLMAIQDAINLGDYDEIIISTLPRRVSRWLKLDLVSEDAGARPARHAVEQDRAAGAGGRRRIACTA